MVKTRAGAPIYENPGNGQTFDLSKVTTEMWAMGVPFVPLLYAIPVQGPDSLVGYVGSESLAGETRGFGLENPVQHTYTKYTQGRFNYIKSFYQNGTWNWTQRRGQLFAPPQIAVGVAMPFVPQGADAYALTSRGWQAVQPVYKPRMSATNFVIELKDFKSLVRLVGQGKAAVSKIASNVRSKHWSKSLAELQLTSEYAVKPLVRDVVDISSSVGDLMSSLDRYNKQGAQWNTLHYTEKCGFIRTTANVGWYNVISEQTGVYNCSLRSCYQAAVDNALDYGLQHFGLTLTPAQVWNAIPFSFVVDQFITVGQALESVSKNASVITAAGVFLESFKSRIEHCYSMPSNTDYFTGGTGTQVSGNVGKPMATAVKQSYSRYISLPPVLGGVVWPRFKQPSVSNLVNDLCLVRARSGSRADSSSLFNGPKD